MNTLVGIMGGHLNVSATDGQLKFFIKKEKYRYYEENSCFDPKRALNFFTVLMNRFRGSNITPTERDPVLDKLSAVIVLMDRKA